MTTEKPHHLPDAYWKSLEPAHRAMYDVVRPMPTAAYTFDCRLSDIERSIARLESDCLGAGGAFELVPDFQRGHVWDQRQQIAFMESVLRKTAPARILFNCPGWVQESTTRGDIPENHMQCIDGLQRLTAVRAFMAGEFKVFGRYSVQDLHGSPFMASSYTLQIAVYTFSKRADLLQFYLDLNAGGTVHSSQEIDRVRALLASASQLATP